MLVSLRVENLILIESVELTFSAGLNIITGETGAGKSVIVDALLALLGEKMPASAVRQGAQKAIIEGVFSTQGNNSVKQFLEEHNFDIFGEEVILRREISLKGSSRSFVNDTPANLTVMKTIGDMLVDFHGQHEHQSLLRSEHHLKFIDNVGGLGGLVDEMKKIYAEVNSLQKEYHRLVSEERSLREQAEYRKFLLQEIEQVSPQPDEEATLLKELQRIENAEKLFAHAIELYNVLYGGDESARDTLIRARTLLDELARFEEDFQPWRTELQSAIISLEEIAKYSQSYSAEIEFSPERLEEIRLRLRDLTRLRKKYGSNEEIFKQWEFLRRQIQLTDNFDVEIQRLLQALTEARQRAGKHAAKLTKKRRDVAKSMERSIVEVLKTVGITAARFEVRFDEVRNSDISVLADGVEKPCSAIGTDVCTYFIATNAGMDLQPLAKTASGGEISRVMLALKTIVAQSDRLPMLVFDEIDTGISGRIAQKVGIAMKNLARYHQIIAITHLPQIAALGDSHIVVKKEVEKKKTVIRATTLSEQEHFVEVAKLLSGEDVTPAALQSAKELALAGRHPEKNIENS